MLRMLPGVRPTNAKAVVFHEFGVRPLYIHWLKRMATFYHYLLALPLDHILAAVLQP